MPWMWHRDADLSSITIQSLGGSPSTDFLSVVDTTTQPIAVANTFQILTFNTVIAFNGFTVVAGVLSDDVTGTWFITYRIHVADDIVGDSNFFEAHCFDIIADAEVKGSQCSARVGGDTLFTETGQSFIYTGTSPSLKIQIAATNTDVKVKPLGGTAVTPISASVDIVRIK